MFIVKYLTTPLAVTNGKSFVFQPFPGKDPSTNIGKL